MKAKVEAGITAYKDKFSEGTRPLRKATEVIYMYLNFPDTHHIAKMKLMDEVYRKYILN